MLQPTALDAGLGMESERSKLNGNFTMKAKILFSYLTAGMLVLNATDSAFAQAARAAETKIPKTPAIDVARQLNEAFVEVAERVSPAVVVITTTQKRSDLGAGAEEHPLWDLLPPEWRKRFKEEYGEGGRPRPGPTGRGSGIIISEDGYILTNNHVVEDAEKITVRFKDSRQFEAEVRGRDPQSDLAVIKIKDAKGLVHAKLGDSSAARPGEFVLAIGAPFDLDYSVTVGHISAKGRAFAELGPYADQDFIQTDASINPGNSGGPLVNLYGEVIGINTMIRGLGLGIGFAIPSDIARKVAENLIKTGKFTRSRIGIEIRDFREELELREVFPKVMDGVIVRGIQSGGPAAASDLRPSDVIVAVEGKPVKTSRELKEQVSYTPPGQTITLDVIRPESGGKTRNVKVKVKTEAIPDDRGGIASMRRGQTPSAPAVRSDLGLTVRTLTEAVADEFGIDATQGVIVTVVEPGSSAEKAGFRPGDVITGVNHTPVKSLRDFREAMKNADRKRGVTVSFISEGSRRFTILKEQ
ncbi:MAG: trypsin-like peptidase domain-containing protein [Verrucomicrobia bacterium]|nr:trypsin-like peptidase domain-containing protein [Verrucomicrobiota bacterium]